MMLLNFGFCAVFDVCAVLECKRHFAGHDAGVQLINE